MLDEYLCQKCNNPIDGIGLYSCFCRAIGAGFNCNLCGDTGEVWARDPNYPNMARCDILVPCQCQKDLQHELG